jgi:hypothetical protein
MKSSHGFFHNNGLSIVLFVIFIFLVIGQIISGWHNHNNERVLHGEVKLELTEYLQTGTFGEAIFENWESEFLQMGIYVIITAYLFQRGSSESRDPDEEKDHETEAKAKQRCDLPSFVKNSTVLWFIYKHSLSIAFILLFAGSFIGHAIYGAKAYNDEAVLYGEHSLTTWEYMGNSQFWFESFQNWQSEFLAIFAIVVLSIWLREKHSPESKPLHAKNDETGA